MSSPNCLTLWLSLSILILAGCGDSDDVPSSGTDAAAAVDGASPTMDAGGLADAGAAPDGGGAEPDAGPVPPRELAPCETASCWETTAALDRCGTFTISENYSTARYNVHAYATTFYGGTTTRITLRRTAGMFPPAILLHDGAGTTLSDGENGVLGPGTTVTVESNGRRSDEAAVVVQADADVSGIVHVTGWPVVDEGFVSFLGTDVTYDLSIASSCE